MEGGGSKRTDGKKRAGRQILGEGALGETFVN